MKRMKTVRIILAVIVMLGCFGGCKDREKTTSDPYVFTVDSDPEGKLKWQVSYSDSKILTEEIKENESNGKTEITFKGLKKGKTVVKVFLAPPGTNASHSDNVYALELTVNKKLGVTEEEPRYGSYTVNCGNAMAGTKWTVSAEPEGIVHCDEIEKHFDSDSDGMQNYDMVYTFTGKKPGAVKIDILNTLPSTGETFTLRSLMLYVDGDYKVSELEKTDFKSFRLKVQGSTAGADVTEATKTEDGALLRRYTLYTTWNDIGPVETIEDEKKVEGGEELYNTLAGLLQDCGAANWDGFHGSDPRVLDGYQFVFELTLADGKVISASGSNSYPDGYSELQSVLYRLLPVS